MKGGYYWKGMNITVRATVEVACENVLDSAIRIVICYAQVFVLWLFGAASTFQRVPSYGSERRNPEGKESTHEPRPT
jgi:hypothetical protein